MALQFRVPFFGLVGLVAWLWLWAKGVTVKELALIAVAALFFVAKH